MSFVAQAGAASLTPAETGLLGAINKVRRSHHLPPLEADRHLEAVARRHSRWMLHSGEFTHGDFGRRVTHAHAAGPTFGENLAWGTGRYATPAAIVRAWLASPEHRAILLRRGFRRIGIGQADGPFGGFDSAAVVTADFAGR